MRKYYPLKLDEIIFKKWLYLIATGMRKYTRISSIYTIELVKDCGHVPDSLNAI